MQKIYLAENKSSNLANIGKIRCYETTVILQDEKGIPNPLQEKWAELDETEEKS